MTDGLPQGYGEEHSPFMTRDVAPDCQGLDCSPSTHGHTEDQWQYERISTETHCWHGLPISVQNSF